MGGSNHSHATQDLYDSIDAGQYPEWTLAIQTMDPREEDKFDFDPLDVTKIWPENLFPLQPVGRLVLNQNPSNFFSENEMLVSHPLDSGLLPRRHPTPGGEGGTPEYWRRAMSRMTARETPWLQTGFQNMYLRFARAANGLLAWATMTARHMRSLPSQASESS